MRFKTIAVAALTCLALVIPGSALAASSPTQDAYSGVAGQQQGGESQPATGAGNEAAPTSVASESAPEATEEASSSGTLPFTGFEIALIALIGGALLVTGILLYRRSRDAAQPQG